MKSMKKEDHFRIRKVLAAAYREKEKAVVGDLWQTRVMGHIRSLGPLYPATSYLEFFERFVWRLAPVACALILILAAIFMQMDFISEYEMAKIFFDDPADISLFQQTRF
jgi:hypothetical protein